MTMIFTYLVWTLLAVICVTAFLLYKRHIEYYKPLRKLPGSPPIFLIGNMYGILRLRSKSKSYKHHSGVYFTEQLMGESVIYRETGMHCTWFGPIPFVNIYKAEIAKLVLNSNISIEKSLQYEFLHDWLGDGLITSKGAKWRHRRRLLMPSLHFRILEGFVPAFNRQSMELVKNLKSHSDKEYVDVAPLIILCALDAVCETVMGISIGAQKSNNSEYVQAIQNAAEFFSQRTKLPWLWNDFLFGLTDIGKAFNRGIHILHSFTDKVIREKKERMLSGETESKPEEGLENEYCAKRRKTFMDLLLDMHLNGQQLSETDIREEVDTFMFAGHDTTAMGIIFALYLIGLYPEVQKKITDELDSIFGDDVDRAVTYEDTRNMKYLECVLKENQRLFPSVPIIGRKLEEDIHFEGLKIPKKTTVTFNLMGLHRDPKAFPNPEIFDPDRFLPENSIDRHPYAFIPFSAGPRNCIGQKFAMLEEKTIICNILRHFEIISLDPRDKFHIKMEFTLQPAQEVRMKFLPKT